ncbi:redox-sensing transcriptional repressor Rex [Gottschalkia acidurici 9a]|uniref:Redox-sensing transcriptional repressor Rex n=1 Tax=Gottschalkia acidurici (strain ATCC 7906 / DSM 604 / BCRC 14475 / CIP 104303 / KCTC 5404 / NCIMB 10678 / 9a) TaxID=1128398 RepID=K0AU44_GOTA9|nr:redox-sensing transcriptional repressor Rex [Gottschalkia acidurici]AFS77358.1 redox-sensing transcriptional repressor Rex [Gottschalkia acidurici 9a]
MNKYENVSMAVIRRLPKYYRYINELIEKDVSRISSYELSKLTGFTASQIRQDLNNFGGFGQQGYGYSVEVLKDELAKILGLDKGYSAIIVGAGNLGQAIANYRSFEDRGFRTLALFEKNPKLIGLKIRDIEIKDLDDIEKFTRENEIDIAIITTPKEQAQDVADKVVSCGIRAIWNFAPIDLKVDKDIIVENVDLNESLYTLSFLLKQNIK